MQKFFRTKRVYCWMQVHSPEGLKQEVPHMIDVVTTNKTDFFREQTHFDLLYQELLPAWLQQAGGRRRGRGIAGQ